MKRLFLLMITSFAKLTVNPLFINFETEIKLRREFRTYYTSGKTNVLLFWNSKTTTPIATAEIVALDAKVNLISPSWHCLVDLNPCNVLQMWLVAPESMHKLFEVSVIKLTSTTCDSIIPWTFVAKKSRQSLFQWPGSPHWKQFPLPLLSFFPLPFPLDLPILDRKSVV